MLKDDKNDLKTLPAIDNNRSENKNKTLSSHRGEKSSDYYSVSPKIKRDSSIKKLR